MPIPSFSDMAVPAQTALIVGLAFVAAWFARWVFAVGVHRLTARTETELDDILARRLRGPVSGSVFLYGVWFAVHRLSTSPTAGRVLESALYSAALLLWSFGFARALSEVLAWLTAHQDQWSIVTGRTLPLLDMAGKAVIYGGLVYFLFLAWGVDVTGWLASAGIVGVAVGFASKDTLANLIAGIFILADAPYKLGDYLILESGQRGVVTEIGVRTTRLLTRDDVEIIVPNGIMANAIITNESGGPYEKTRLKVPIGVAYGTDIDVVRQILCTVPTQVPGISEVPPPNVRFDAFGASSLDFTLRLWIDRPADRGRVTDAVNTRIYNALVEAGIEIPYNKYDVYLHQPPATPTE